MRALLVHTQSVFAGACFYNAATHEAPSRGVTLHIPRWISRLTGPSLEEKCPVGATHDGDEPCLPKLSRTLKTGRTRLRYQTGLASSTNGGPAVPMVTDSHSQTNKTSQYTIPDLFFPVTVSSWTARIPQVGLYFIDPVLKF